MDTTPSTTPGPERLGGDHEKWPVLARLPDVGDRLRDSAARSNKAAAAGFVNYRFDPPQTAASRTAPVTSAARSVQSAGVAASGTAEPHVFHRSQRTDRRERLMRLDSMALPTSDPFAIPQSRLSDTLAPVGRFLLLFALFTAAGTAFLMSTRPAEIKVDLPSTTAQQEIGTPAIENRSKNEPTPTAAGPLGNTVPRTGTRTKDGNQSATRHRKSAAVGPTTSTQVATSSGQPLPQVRTADEQSTIAGAPLIGPPAVARLSGTIQEVPTRQAQHDDNQSSLH